MHPIVNLISIPPCLADCVREAGHLQILLNTVRVENFEVVLISRFSWVADDTKIIHVEGGINTREIV